MQDSRTAPPKVRVGTAVVAFGIMSALFVGAAVTDRGFVLGREFALAVLTGTIVGGVIARIEVIAAERYRDKITLVTDIATIATFCVFGVAALLHGYKILHDGWSIFGAAVGATLGRVLVLWWSLIDRTPSRT